MKYTPEKLKSLEATMKFRKNSYQDMIDKIDKIKETIKTTGLNTLKNVNMLEDLCEVQNGLRTEMGFNRAFIDEIARQQKETATQ